MFGLNQASLSFADRPLLDEVSFIINKQDKIGLVGKNGAGKTTLLKCLAKLQGLDKGEVSYPQDFKIGYLPQDMDFEGGRTVWEETKTAFIQINEIQSRIESINNEIVGREDYESDEYLTLLDQLAELNEKLIHLDVDSVDAKMEQILLGLGFSSKDFVRLTDEFSGGWRMRIELAKILLEDADLLLLDEPTNHLDIESIQWLEGFLKNFQGALVLISHDRTFLDELTNRTIEISLGKIHDYKAPYTKYLQLRVERREQTLAAYENQQKEIKQTEDFINRFRAKATKAVQVQSRIKHLNKIDRIEIEEEDTAFMRFSFPPAPHSGKVILELNDIKKSYDDKLILDKVNLSLERGEKVSFVGKNGEGKSTLSRIINGEKFESGEVKLGYQVKIGYFAQNQAEILNPNKTVFQVIDDAAKGEIRTKIRSLLGSFLFQGDDVDKKVKVLSGGERARLAMCKLLLEPVNLLILDEPTNHLDIKSKEILKESLKAYDGTMIVISHDRDFLKGLTEKVYEFKDKNVKEYLGGIEYFLSKKEHDDFRSWELEKKANEPKEKELSKPSVNLYEKRKEYKKVKNKVRKLETDIERLEKEIETLNTSLKDPSLYENGDNKDLIDKWEKTNRELSLLMGDWESQIKIAEELESVLN